VGTEKVTNIVDGYDSTAVISQISVLEFHSHLALKVRDTASPGFDKNSFDRVCGLLCYHIISGKFGLIELPDNFIYRATDLIRDHGCDKELRHMDAIQLSGFLDYLRINGDATFVASDKKLLKLCSNNRMVFAT
jgi:hypothetical protein